MGNKQLNKKLVEAVKDSDVKEVKLLIQEGADVNLKIKEDFTALMFAVNFGLTDIVKLLIENGADVEVKTKQGITALMLSENKEISKLLRENGVSGSCFFCSKEQLNLNENYEVTERLLSYAKTEENLIEHIDDIDIKALYAGVQWEPEKVLELGKILLEVPKCEDKTAILEIMCKALKNLIEGAEEHEEEYDESEYEENEQYLEKLENRIEKLKKEGETSNIFSLWTIKYNEQMNGYADEFLDEE